MRCRNAALGGQDIRGGHVSEERELLRASAHASGLKSKIKFLCFVLQRLGRSRGVAPPRRRLCHRPRSRAAIAGRLWANCGGGLRPPMAGPAALRDQWAIGYAATRRPLNERACQSSKARAPKCARWIACRSLPSSMQRIAPAPRNHDSNRLLEAHRKMHRRRARVWRRRRRLAATTSGEH